MTNVFFDAMHNDEERRTRLYNGDIYVFSPRDSTRAFCEFARSMIVDAFAPRDPETAQYSMPVAEYAALLGKLKPAFIHHPESKRLIHSVLEDFGCPLDKTYFEVPKLRSSTSDNYLTAGIAYAWHPHRDTWYSAPSCQINWWTPVFPISEENCMAFHPRYWSEPVPNTSAGYNYYEWNEKYRGTHITQYINHDPRPLPAPVAPIDHANDLRLVCPPGGLILFSAAHLHSSVPNASKKTRFSVDFRTACLSDLTISRGALNIDSACTGTVLREFKRATDLADLPQTVLEFYEDGTEHLGRPSYA